MGVVIRADDSRGPIQAGGGTPSAMKLGGDRASVVVDDSTRRRHGRGRPDAPIGRRVTVTTGTGNRAGRELSRVVDPAMILDDVPPALIVVTRIVLLERGEVPPLLLLILGRLGRHP